MIDEKELIEQLIDKYNTYYNNEIIYDEQGAKIAKKVISDICVMITDQEKVGEWITFSESFPDPGEEVLCCDTYSSLMIGYVFEDYSSNTGYVCKNEYSIMYDSIAWMPLPEPFRGKQ